MVERSAAEIDPDNWKQWANCKLPQKTQLVTSVELAKYIDCSLLLLLYKDSITSARQKRLQPKDICA